MHNSKEISGVTKRLGKQGLYLAIYREGEWCTLEPGHTLMRPDLLCTIDVPMHEEEVQAYIEYCLSLPEETNPWDVLQWRVLGKALHDSGE